MRLRSSVPLALAVAALSGCPEERADAKRPLPRERLPPAVSVQPTIGPATPAPVDSREEASPTLEPAGTPTPGPAGTAGPGAPPAPTPTPTPTAGADGARAR